jgi:hypothetical protein
VPQRGGRSERKIEHASPVPGSHCFGSGPGRLQQGNSGTPTDRHRQRCAEPSGSDRDACAGRPSAFGQGRDAAAIPALKAQLDADLAKQRDELIAEAKEGKADAKEGGFPYNPHSRMMDWKVVTDLPHWLSMSTIVSTFEGGAHPNYVYDAMLWDKAANVQRDALDLFTAKKALSAAIGKAFCDAIDRQRTKKRGEPIVRNSGDMFTNCLDPVDYTVILGSAGHQGFDRIGILVPPYEAGPYVEGSYEVTLPITGQVLALVKPEYRASFVVAR